MSFIEIICSLPSEGTIKRLIEKNYGIFIEDIRLYKVGAGNTFIIDTKNERLLFKMVGSLYTDDKVHGKAFRIRQSVEITEYLHSKGFPAAEVMKTIEYESYILVPFIPCLKIRVFLAY